MYYCYKYSDYIYNNIYKLRKKIKKIAINFVASLCALTLAESIHYLSQYIDICNLTNTIYVACVTHNIYVVVALDFLRDEIYSN